MAAMDGFGYACAIVLAAIFVRSGTAKLARPGVTAASFSALGVPGSAAAARMVPATELVVAALLLGLPRIGGSLAVGILLAFTLILRRAIRSGSTAPCNCLGSAASEPVSRVDVLRNGLLLLLAVAAGRELLPRVPSPLAALVATMGVGAGYGVYRLARTRWAPGPG